MPHEIDVCNDDQWHPHQFKWVNHLNTPVTIKKNGNHPWPFDRGPDIILQPGKTDCAFISGIQPGTYYYDVVGCGRPTPRTVIIS
jgi:hypothetical protein